MLDHNHRHLQCHFFQCHFYKTVSTASEKRAHEYGYGYSQPMGIHRIYS
jgi:hypothetical protein